MSGDQFHQIDAGLMIEKFGHISNDEDDEKEKESDVDSGLENDHDSSEQYRDQKIVTIIEQNRRNLQRQTTIMMERYEKGTGGGTGKFVLQTNQHGTFIDSLLSFFIQLDGDFNLCKMAEENQYDTDAVEMDLELMEHFEESNLGLALKKRDPKGTSSLNMMQRITQFVNRFKSSCAHYLCPLFGSPLCNDVQLTLHMML